MAIECTNMLHCGVCKITTEVCPFCEFSNGIDFDFMNFVPCVSVQNNDLVKKNWRKRKSKNKENN